MKPTPQPQRKRTGPACSENGILGMSNADLAKAPKQPRAQQPKKLGRILYADAKLCHLSTLPVGYTIGNAWRVPHMRRGVLVFDLRDYPEAVERVARELARQESVSKHWRYFRRRAEAILQSALNWPAPTKGEGK